jgi:hypothetical protein
VAEIQMLKLVVPNGRRRAGSGVSSGEFGSQATWLNAYELTYGLSDRIEAAAYLNLAQASGNGMRYAGSKYRLRGRLLTKKFFP